MIDRSEVEAAALARGVSPSQIEKDHLISHVLSAIGATGLDVWFYGGTALHRTILNNRVSEDIDLMVDDIEMDLHGAIASSLRRGVGDTGWTETTRVSWMRTFLLESDVAQLKIQLVRLDKRDRLWGWVPTPVRLFYSCLDPAVELQVPDGPGFVAMKLGAYMDRHAPRDLFDLSLLAGAARVDGSSDIRMFSSLVVPLLRPGLATVAIFSALNAWNEFLLALLYVQSDELKTIPTGLLAFSSRYVTDYQLLFSALTIVTVPMIAVYVMFHRQIVAGITEGSLK